MTRKYLPTRRDALRVGTLGALGLSLADYLRLAEGSELQPKADACIFLHLAGGPSHLDTFDMKPKAPAEEQGEFKSIQSSMPELRVCEHLPKMAKVIDRFALLRGVSHSAGAHPQANQYLYSGNRPSPAIIYPAHGSVLTKERPSDADLPSYVAVPGGDMTPGFLGIAYAPLNTTAIPKKGQPFEMRGLALEEGTSLAKVRSRDKLLADLDTTFRETDSGSELLTAMDRFGRKAQEMILSPRAREAFDVGRESQAMIDLFEADDLSQSMLLALRLVEHGVRFVTITHAGWDTHLDNFTNLKGKLLPAFDAAMSSLVEAMQQKGLSDRVLVVASGEMGRTPTINKNAGRDHWPRAMWTLMTGGGVKTGQLIGGTDEKGHGPDDATDMTPDDLAASLYHALGVDHRHEYYTATGRPVILVPEGRVIEGLFA
ncbi:MAG: DUF1501 domain-containing protein [Pirellulaceae bacterium]